MTRTSRLAIAAGALIAGAIGACGPDEGGGTGGASGKGGSGGSAGGAGGAGGSGGASGGGSGGASGSGGGSTGGSSGTGGASTGGSAGSGGSTGTPCTACIETQCPDEVSACQANSDCVAIFACYAVENCSTLPEPRVCVDQCAASNPGGGTLFDPVFDCAETACVPECSG